MRIFEVLILEKLFLTINCVFKKNGNSALKSFVRRVKEYHRNIEQDRRDIVSVEYNMKKRKDRRIKDRRISLWQYDST